MPQHELAILDAATVDFVTGCVSIDVGACGPAGIPAMSRSLGCRVSDDAREIMLLFRESAATEVLDAVRRNGLIAAVFSDPPSHRTLQLKGSDALVIRAATSDVALAADYARKFATVLVRLGHTKAMVNALLACPPDELVMVRFSPSSAFSQTPGPRAGEPLKVSR